jgi:hypothetical protein
MIELMHNIKAKHFPATAHRHPLRGGRVAGCTKIVGREPEGPATIALLDHQEARARTVKKLAHVGRDSRDWFADFGHRSLAYIEVRRPEGQND